MSIGFLDTETRCAIPIQHGTDKYCRAAECMIVTWARDDEPVRIWDALDEPLMPLDLQRMLEDESCKLVAHNASFDRDIVRYALKIPTRIDRWHCTSAQASSHGLPAGLELLGQVLNLGDDHQKLGSGKELIQLFCVPKGDGNYVQPVDKPVQWKEFCDYAVRDTDSLREIYKRLATTNYSGANLALYHLDQRINERGFGFDVKFAQAAVEFLKDAKATTDASLAKATSGVVTAATQRARLLKFLQEKYKLDIPNLRAAEIRSMLEMDDLHPEVRFLLETRLEAGKSSGSKYRRGLQTVGPNLRIRHAIRFNGAGRTGRSSGKNFQPHNMARPVLTVKKDGRLIQIPVKAKFIDEIVMPGIYSKAALHNDLVYGGPNEAAALTLRHSIKAAIGNVLTVADWKNVEGRACAWMAGEEWKLLAYAAQDAGTGSDLYKMLFAQFFGMTVEEVDDIGRQGGKVVDLSMQFGGGVGALVTMAATYQMELEPLVKIVLPRATPQQMKKAEKAWRRAFLSGEDYGLEPAVYKACDVLKQTYRASNAAIDQLRSDVDGATKAAIKSPGRSFVVGKCKIWATSTWLIIQLPSGRRLLYANPRVETEAVEDPDSGKVRNWEYISYATVRGRTWRRERAWSGLFVENMVQAVANDILRAALLHIDGESRQLPAVQNYLVKLPPEEQTAIALHVHDEVVLDLPPNAVTLEQLITWMTTDLIKKHAWLKGFPLAAEGWVNSRYGKR